MAFCGKEMGEDQARKIFDQWDADGSGFVDRQELLNILLALAKDLGVDEDECKASTGAIIAESNTAGEADNKLSFDEFKTIMGL